MESILEGGQSMSPVESYIVATVFVAAAGFSCGYGIRTLEMSNAKELGKQTPTILGLLGFVTVPALFIYGIRWGLLIDGPRFIWVPPLVAWLLTLAYGRRMAYQERSVLLPWRLPVVGAAIVTVGYHLLQDQLSK
jgi:hypothetical protein